MQIVGYDRSPNPALVIADDGKLQQVPLAPGDTLEYPLGDRHCAGWTEDGRHHGCSEQSVPWCPDHTETWICARCRGTCLKDVMDCHDPHVVYLAIVAPDVAKVGVTKAHRIERRLSEQGADRGVVIHQVANGRIAREIEAEIAQELPERIRISQKIGGLSQTVDEAAWSELLAGFRPQERYEPSYDFDLDDQPIQETLARGTVRGVKGRLLLIENGGNTYVTDLRDLVGHDVATNPSDRALQSGLAAFE